MNFFARLRSASLTLMFAVIAGCRAGTWAADNDGAAK
jgi:hypothetical protein